MGSFMGYGLVRVMRIWPREHVLTDCVGLVEG